MRRNVRIALLMAGILLLVVLPIGPAFAATITVDSTADVAANDGLCTLREAITAANSNHPSGGATPLAGECAGGGSAGQDVISFAIPGDGPHTIRPASGLPTITQSVLIDGYTQAGSSANTLAEGSNAILRIQLDGTNAGDFAQGLAMTATGVAIRGLVINRFHSGIRIDGAGGNVIDGNFIGTDVTGTIDLGNRNPGIQASAPNNTIGGTLPAARNVLSGNGSYGVTLDGSTADGNLVAGNLIGTNAGGNRRPRQHLRGFGGSARREQHDWGKRTRRGKRDLR